MADEAHPPTWKGIMDIYNDDEELHVNEEVLPDHSPEEIEHAHTQVEQILVHAVHLSTGRTDFAPRAGQVRLARNITTSAMLGHVGKPNIAEAPTGLGKSFAALAPAAYMSSLSGEEKRRTVIATESIALQGQYVDKDAPVIAEATKMVTGYEPKIVLLKGWSNYVCLASAISVAEEILGLTPGEGESDIESVLAGLEAFKNPFVPVQGNVFDHGDIIPVLIWGISEGIKDGSGDKSKYPGTMRDDVWRLISVPPAECAGAKCPLADICLPRKAKTEAATADIIITNHSMLAVQAATGAKVILGNSKLESDEYPFPLSIVIVDEAHAMPNIVRNQGQGEISAARIFSLVRAMNKLVTPELSAPWSKDAEPLATMLNAALEARSKGTRDGDVVRLSEDELPLNGVADAISAWLARGMSIAAPASKNPSTSIQIAYRRVESAFDSFEQSFDAVNEHRRGVARWVEPPVAESFETKRRGAVARSAPVDVSGMLRYNLWEDHYTNPDTEVEEVFNRTVVAMSATLPSGFGFQMGLRDTQKIAYDSPFEVAYENSALYVPMFTKDRDFSEHWSTYDFDREEIVEPRAYSPEILGIPGYGGRYKFDSRKHEGWATARMLPLVERNGGRALVLSATRRSGERYVRALRKHAAGRWTVYSQWEGESVPNLVSAWKADETSVLVGTKSLMTGVDAPGQTNSLVIMDRPPRARGNPVDDARVELFMEKMDCSKWDGDRMVYVSDAALLLEQAAGRGIRQVTDEVLICVLDPRMLRRGEFTYPKQTQESYMRGLRKFGAKLTHVEDAFDFIDDLRSRHPEAEPKASAYTALVGDEVRSGGIDFAKLFRESNEADAAEPA